MKNYKNNSKGFVLPVLIFTVTIIMILIATAASLSLASYSQASHDTYRVDAQLTADAGIDAAINSLNTDTSWTGTTGEVELMNANNIRTTYQTSVLAGSSSDRKVIAVTSRSYSPANSTTPKLTRKYEVDIQAVTSGTMGPSSVVSGVGGLYMTNNSKITGGDVVVNGTVYMSNQSQIGTQSNAVNVRVADQNCPQPPDSTFPQVCTGGSQPITMNNNSKIYGQVYANNQTTGTNMYNPGLVVGQTVTPFTLPAFDRSSFTVTKTVSSNDPSVTCGNNGNLTWQAGLKITGNVNLGNNCKVTINGDVWITGTLTTGNNGRIVVADGVGTTRPLIMVDGSSGFTLANNGTIQPNASGTGIEMRTFWSTATCSPDCSNVTGVDLANSKGHTTINLGNNGNAPNSVFIAQWSQVYISNNGQLGAVAGQTIYMSNQAIINFTASVPGSDNLTQTWVKRGYMRVFN